VGEVSVLEPLITASVKVTKATYQGPSSVVTVELENTSDATFMLQNQSSFTFHSDSDIVIIKPHSTTTIEVKTLEQRSDFELRFEILNALIAPNQHPVIAWNVDVDI
jgi:hypothetical protein